MIPAPSAPSTSSPAPPVPPAPGLTGSIALVYEPNGDAKLNCDVGGALQTDPRNCGAIGNDVTRLSHATSTCVAGQPQIAACDTGWFELEGNPSVGCDISAGAYEPNDTAAGGFQLRNHPSKLRAAISPAGEADWYFFHNGFFPACGQTEMSIFSKDDSVRFDLFLNGAPVAQNLTQHFLGSLDGLLDIFVHAPAAGGYQLSFSRNFSTAC